MDSNKTPNEDSSDDNPTDPPAHSNNEANVSDARLLHPNCSFSEPEDGQ